MEQREYQIFEYGSARAVYYSKGTDVYAYPDGKTAFRIVEGWLQPLDGSSATLYFGLSDDGEPNPGQLIEPSGRLVESDP
jgi:hypothetical protein